MSEPRRYDQLIDGVSVESIGGGRMLRHDPATGALVADFAEGTTADVAAAVASARKAHDSGVWSQRSGAERGALLSAWADLIEAHAERLAGIEVQEVGKPIRQARGGLAASVDLVRYAAASAHHVLTGSSHTDFGRDYSAFVLREPVGVVAALVPWNFPALLFAQKVPYAMAAGCPVVAKPSEFTSSTAHELALLALEAGLPPGVLNVVTGLGRVVGDGLARAKGVDFVSFTGSTASGRAVMAAASTNVTHLSLELGGKGANIVFADADVDSAVEAILVAAYFNQGQCCSAGSRLLVQDSVAERLTARLLERSSQLVVGDPTLETTDIGAMIHEDHAASVLQALEAAADAGARPLLSTGRVWPLGQGTGSFVGPSVLAAVTPTMELFQREVFGPVVSITRFSTEAEAISLVNATEYGLAHAVWTQDLSRAIQLWRDIRSGTVWVNTSMESRPGIPFGGVGSSGFGTEMGQEGASEFTATKILHLRSKSAGGFFAG